MNHVNLCTQKKDKLLQECLCNSSLYVASYSCIILVYIILLYIILVDMLQFSYMI